MTPGRLALLLGALSAFPAMTIDLYLPGMPQMAEDLHTSPGFLQLTVTLFVIGLALGQLVVGPVSDARGRRGLLLAGLAGYVVASVCCLVAPTALTLLVARVVQSLGAAAATVLSRAIVRDRFEGAAMTRFLATLLLVNGVATICGPLVGGQMIALAGWRSVFAFLAALGAVLLVVVAVALPETLEQRLRRPAGSRAVVAGLLHVGRDRDYLRLVLAGSFMFAAMFAYITASSFVLQDAYALSPTHFSLVFAVNAVGIVVAGQANSRLLGRSFRGRALSERALLTISLVVAATAGLGVLAATRGGLPLAFLLASLFVLVSMLGPVLANTTSLALAPHAASAGTAASLLGVLQHLVAGVTATAMSALAGQDVTDLPAAMALTIVLTSTAALLLAVLGRRAGRQASRSTTSSPTATLPGLSTVA
jgi:DHA1 family bicyclomycin/chloramphenicol resistance-like MFS transporter